MQNDCFPDAPAEWAKGPVSDLAIVNPRYRLEKGREYPFVEMAAVGEQFAGIQRFDTRALEGSGLSRFKANDTLFAKITPCPQNGKIAFVPSLPGEAGLGSTEFIVLSPKPGIHPKYLYHLLCTHSVRGRAAARMEGSTGRQRVPDDVFRRRLLVPLRSFDEQAAVSRLLDAVDTAIASTLEAARLTRCVRRSFVEQALRRGLAAVPDGPARKVVETRAGRLPADWRLSSVAAEFTLKNGITLNEKARANQQPRNYLRVANVQRERLDLSDVQQVGVSDAEFIPRRLEVGDLLIVEGHADRMQIGRCAVVSPPAAGMTFQNHLFRLRSQGAVDPNFACLWFNSTFAQRFWNARCATSSGLNTINQRTLKTMLFPVPKPDEQERISLSALALERRACALDVKVRRLVVLKKALADAVIGGGIATRLSATALAEIPS